MNVAIAALDFLLLLAVLRLVAWPLLAPRSTAAAPSATPRRTVPVDVSARIEQAVAARKAALTAANCADCGQRIDDDDRFCRSCGAAVVRPGGDSAVVKQGGER